MPQSKVVRDFENEVLSKAKAFEDASLALENDIAKQITSEYLQCVFSQKDLLITMQGCKKPGDLKFLMKPVTKSSGDVKALQNKDPKWTNHVRTIGDGFNLFCWYLSP